MNVNMSQFTIFLNSSAMITSKATHSLNKTILFNYKALNSKDFTAPLSRCPSHLAFVLGCFGLVLANLKHSNLLLYLRILSKFWVLLHKSLSVLWRPATSFHQAFPRKHCTMLKIAISYIGQDNRIKISI